MEEIGIILERHEQKIKHLEDDIVSLREIQNEIKSMNEVLITLTNELKHTKEHLERHDVEIEEMDRQPKQRLQQIITAVVSALAGALISAAVGFIFT